MAAPHVRAIAMFSDRAAAGRGDPLAEGGAIEDGGTDDSVAERRDCSRSPNVRHFRFSGVQGGKHTYLLRRLRSTPSSRRISIRIRDGA